MVFSKYLFTTIAGLTGGVNAWAFTSSGGAVVSKELEGIDGELNTSSGNNDKLINQESERLKKEKSESDEKFNKLDGENKKTHEKSRTRRSAGDSLRQSDYDLRKKQTEQNKNLNEKRKTLQTTLESKTNEFKNSLENGAKSAFETVQKSVQEETQKLSDALTKLKDSNRQLIEKVRNCIQELPQSIFIEPNELKNKSYCDYVAEQKKNQEKT